MKNISITADLIGRYGPATMAKYFKNRMYYDFKKKVLKERFTIKDIHNYKMILDMEDIGISRALLLFGSREEDHKYILEKELKPGMTVLDLGANVGYYALMECNLVGENGFVYCLEPHPENYQQLLKNLELNNMLDRVETYNYGGSNRDSLEKLYVSAKSNQHSFCDTRGEKNIANLQGNSETIDVQTVTISSFVKDKKNIDFIRMDIEGFEVEVFEGMIPAIDEDPNFRPSVLFETHKPKYSEPDHSLRKQLQELFKRGYKAKILISDELPRARFAEFGYKPDHVLRTDGITRGLYYNMPDEDIIKFSCDIGSVRGLFLQHESKIK
ncbi:MAG: FkbM family methyltransferase [Oligoflexia bacterium]|nr:FkbM family methyltransferase [Oligoflexia bacterium]